MYRVAVIGAGAAGLCALRHLTAQPGVFEAVAFEQMDDVGGTWIYTENTGKDSKGRSVHSSMYKNLLTNLPKEIMSFPDFPFEKLHPDWPSFIDHQQVLQYLREYANEFKLLPHIQFNTSVERVHPLNCGDRLTAWEVTTRHIDTNARTTQKYDAVFVCNGHYSDPIIPVIEGQDSFTGELTHSHDYRHPEDYKDKTVVLLGAGPSGTDIAFDLAPFAKQVVLSHKTERLKSTLPTNVVEKPAVKKLSANIVVFDDDSELVVDSVIYCTGYFYTYPFLTEESGVTVSEGRVYPLYKHLINARYPRLFFSVVRTLLFSNVDVQVRFALKTLDGHVTLPDVDSMKEEIEADYRWRIDTLGMSHAHRMTMQQWQYSDELVKIAGLKPLQKGLKELHREVVLSHNQDRLRSEMRTNMLQKPGIKNLRGNLVTFLDDSELVVDALMCCTGYLYTFPFLTPESRISMDGQRVYPLFKHLINAEYTRQFFVGICHTICPFPHFDVQIRFCLRTLDGGFRLPDTEALKEDIEADYLWRVNSLGWRHKYAHKLQKYQWEYLNDLAKLAGLSGIKPFVKSLYDEVHGQRQIGLGHYKKCSYQLLDDVSFLQVDNTQ